MVRTAVNPFEGLKRVTRRYSLVLVRRQNGRESL